MQQADGDAQGEGTVSAERALAFGVNIANQLVDAMNSRQAVQPRVVAVSEGPLELAKVTESGGEQFIRSLAAGEQSTPLAQHLKDLLTPGTQAAQKFAQQVGFQPEFICLYWVGSRQASSFPAFGQGAMRIPCGHVLVHTRRSSRLLQCPVDSTGRATFQLEAQIGEIAFANHPLVHLWERAASAARH